MIDRARPRRASLLPEPPLLTSESAEEFERLRDGLEQDIKPSGIIEQIYVADFAYMVWDIGRLRRAKALIIKLAFQASLKDVLTQILRDKARSIDWQTESRHSDKARNIARRWCTDQKIKKQVSDLLQEFGLDQFAIEAESIRASSATLEKLERMLSSLESRRDKALYRVADYRANLAHQLRGSTDKLIEATTVPAL
jgi:hypothetical protein